MHTRGQLFLCELSSSALAGLIEDANLRGLSDFDLGTAASELDASLWLAAHQDGKLRVLLTLWAVTPSPLAHRH